MILVARASSVAGPAGDDEQLLVARAAGGDVEAFEVIYRRHVGKIHALNWRLVSSEQEAEDVTQQVFVRAWQRLDSYRGDGPLGGWLRRIAFNLAADRHRARFRQPEEDSAVEPREPAAAPDRVSDVVMDLERAVRSLPEGPRQVLVLHDIEGLTHREMAELLGVSTGTTKTQLFRARQALREWLS